MDPVVTLMFIQWRKVLSLAAGTGREPSFLNTHCQLVKRAGREVLQKQRQGSCDPCRMGTMHGHVGPASWRSHEGYSPKKALASVLRSPLAAIVQCTPATPLYWVAGAQWRRCWHRWDCKQQLLSLDGSPIARSRSCCVPDGLIARQMCKTPQQLAARVTNFGFDEADTQLYLSERQAIRLRRSRTRDATGAGAGDSKRMLRAAWEGHAVPPCPTSD